MRNMEYDRRVSTYVFTYGKKIDSGSLMCYLYFAQKIGFDLGFNFRASCSGVTSRKAEGYISDLLTNDLLCYDSQSLSYTYNTIRDNEVRIKCIDLDVLDAIVTLMGDLSAWELSFVATLDILQDDAYHTLSGQDFDCEDIKSMVVASMKRFCNGYTDELFEAASERLVQLYKLKSNFSLEV